ncbi:ORF6N domain-containing protein [Thiomicrospira sp. ALE5]|uniref:ORF6N domain-containing protein n=1 Tax=Thiomicrospira sp. ALE5 TaxID=748650 RepID=UPI0008E49D1B|nr:ORF6N domain-containing protein [Thiomicrospira sp. ALE5]SFR49189.1 ORF6N domain-containing protein [Thiomicrospira sp. ALE5]
MPMESLTKIDNQLVQSKIYTVRNTQVMLDHDLAQLYGVQTKALNQAVKRNSLRFPERYCFQLTQQEFENLKSQIVTTSGHGGRRTLPYAFTEQGVSMLSTVLKSETAINTSIRIMDAFVAMRQFISQHALVFERMDAIERKQLKTDSKIDQILDALEAKTEKPEQGIFFNGQIFDAYVFVADLIKSAKQSIIIIDNYLDESVLLMLTKRQANVKAELFGKNNTPQFTLDLQKHNQQYPPVIYYPFYDAHDRFIIIDNQDIYHLGASLKELGKKWFAFSKMEKETLRIMEKLEEARSQSK